MSFGEQSDERDADLVRRVRMRAEQEARDIREWLQQEIKDQINEFGILEASAEGVLKAEFAETRSHLEDINERALVDLWDRMREILKDVDDGEFQTFLDAREALDDLLCRFEALVRELLRHRSVILGHLYGTTPET